MEPILIEYLNKLNSLSTEGSSWVASEQERFISDIYKRREFVRGSDIKLNEPYILMEGCAGFRPNGSADEYFRRGAIVRVLGPAQSAHGKDYVHVQMSGTTFRVTGAGGFANEGATFVFGTKFTECDIPLDRLILTDINSALKAFPSPTPLPQ